jgi:Ca2+-binding RTX toxin-like protein
MFLVGAREGIVWAKARAYRSVDMLNAEVYYGEVLKYGSDEIIISDGYQTTEYRGDFDYDYYGNVYGRLDEVNSLLGSSVVADITNINRSASTFAYYLDYGDAQDVYAYVLSGSDELSGSSYRDVLIGYRGEDVIRGNGGNDYLYGEEHSDRLYGGSGNDLLDGGTWNDRMEGGTGNDRYYVNPARDVVVEGYRAGYDTVNSSVDYKLGSSLERLNLIGTGSVDGTGNSLDNVVKGNRADNVLKGWSGDDILRGEAGSDMIMGGSGKDSLYGGFNADVFVSRSLKEAGIWGERDVIRDFTRNYDVIDLSQIDANTKVAGNQSFRFLEDHPVQQGGW